MSTTKVVIIRIMASRQIDTPFVNSKEDTEKMVSKLLQQMNNEKYILLFFFCNTKCLSPFKYNHVVDQYYM